MKLGLGMQMTNVALIGQRLWDKQHSVIFNKMASSDRWVTFDRDLNTPQMKLRLVVRMAKFGGNW